ncbi:MAG: ATP-binding protein [Nitrospira sp.]|nr:ATP-binding protein [Nitrospira sp.]
MPLNWAGPQWWRALRVQRKVWTVLVLLLAPLLLWIVAYLYFIQQLLVIQDQRHDALLVREQLHVLRRLAIDIDDALHGYVLTREQTFLILLTDAKSKLDIALSGKADISESNHWVISYLQRMEGRLRELLQSRHELVRDIREGRSEQALSYIQSGKGFDLSGAVRDDFRETEDRLDRQMQSFNDEANRISERAFKGLWMAGGVLVLLGFAGSRVLTRSITDPITRLQAATEMLGQDIDTGRVRPHLLAMGESGDELGKLAAAYLEMSSRIGAHIMELEALLAIGMEINTIGPDGLDGVLARITDRAAELVGADVCLVMLKNETMGCWVIEAGSGSCDERLKKSVMLWEEFPVCVQAYESGQPAIGEQCRSDHWPQVVRRNLIGNSLLAIPLRAQGKPFGVLALVSERPRAAHEWNQRLAKGMAQAAAVAISNVRLYEAAQQKQRGLSARLRQLEHLAETLAHDLKGPGARMEELARLLRRQYSGQVDERAARWLALIQENGEDLVRRVEGILEVARVGTGQGAVAAVDPSMVISEVLKERAEEISRQRTSVRVDPGLPLVACHGSYLRQVFDNVISNALKFARPGEPPSIHIGAVMQDRMVCISVSDRGIGIPLALRQRVFHPFIRLAAGSAPGSGIGLTIVQRIVELYGGQVWIEGDEGEGCTVKFTVPCLGGQAFAMPGTPGTIEVAERGI